VANIWKKKVIQLTLSEVTVLITKLQTVYVLFPIKLRSPKQKNFWRSFQTSLVTAQSIAQCCSFNCIHHTSEILHCTEIYDIFHVLRIRHNSLTIGYTSELAFHLLPDGFIDQMLKPLYHAITQPKINSRLIKSEFLQAFQKRQMAAHIIIDSLFKT